LGNLLEKYINVINANKFVELAIEYYYNAKIKNIYTDDGFISAMISMEALFNEGPSDVKYKIAHRAAFLLGLIGNNPIEVFSKLNKYYNDRSKLIHGSGSPEYGSARGDLLDYARTSIIIFLSLLYAENNSKKDLLRKIDYAMLDPKERDALREEICKNIGEFKLPVPRTFKGKGPNGEYKVTPW